LVKKKVAFLFLLALFVCSFSVSAESIGTFKIDEGLQIYQECNNCTDCNFTRAKYPNGTNVLSNLEAIKDGTYYYYDVLGGDLTEIGTYSYCYDCGNSAERATGCLDFELTYNGHQLNTERSLIYLGFIAFLSVLFIYCFYLINHLPDDTRDDDGYILSFSNLKHLRPILYAFAWALLLGIVFLSSNVAIAYLPFAMFGDFLFMIFKLMFIFTIIAIPVWFVYFFVGIFKHKEMKRMLERGVEFGGDGL